MTRKTPHRLCAAFLTWCSACILCSAAAAQSYPSRPVRFVVPSSIGSGVDVLGRIIADALSQVLGQQFVVDNRAGAGNNIAMELVARAPDDGYTLLLATSALASNVHLYRKLAFDPVRDFTPISLIASVPSALCVHSALPAKSLADLIRMAKAKPGALAYASAGRGTASFIAGELFKTMARIDLLHVPYKGGAPAVQAVVSGETPLIFAPVSTCAPMAKQGRARILALASARRLAWLPEVPTAAEAGLPGYEFANWYALLAPAGTPREVVHKLSAATTQVLAKPLVNKRLNDLGYLPVGERPEGLLRVLNCAQHGAWSSVRNH